MKVWFYKNSKLRKLFQNIYSRRCFVILAISSLRRIHLICKKFRRRQRQYLLIYETTAIWKMCNISGRTGMLIDILCTILKKATNFLEKKPISIYVSNCSLTGITFKKNLFWEILLNNFCLFASKTFQFSSIWLFL